MRWNILVLVALVVGLLGCGTRDYVKTAEQSKPGRESRDGSQTHSDDSKELPSLTGMARDAVNRGGSPQGIPNRGSHQGSSVIQPLIVYVPMGILGLLVIWKLRGRHAVAHHHVVAGRDAESKTTTTKTVTALSESVDNRSSDVSRVLSARGAELPKSRWGHFKDACRSLMASVSLRRRLQ